MAGLTDPDYSAGEGNDAAQAHKDAAVTLCCAMCQLYGDSLDRMTMWDRIDSALTVAVSRCDDGDLDRFASACMEHVKAGPGAYARHPVAVGLTARMSAEPASWRQGFVRWVASHRFALLGHARLAWERFKDSQAGGRAAAEKAGAL